MTPLIVDASALGPLLFEDEPDRIAALEAAMPTAMLIVPPNWSLETANMVLMAERKGRIDASARTLLIGLLESLDVEPDDVSFVAVWDETVRLALRHRLTPYDAAYLELAMRRRLPLATLDAALVRAARAEQVEVWTRS